MYKEIVNQKDYKVADQKMQAFQVYVKNLYINVGVVEYLPYYIYNPKTIGAWAGRNWQGIYLALDGIQHAK